MPGCRSASRQPRVPSIGFCSESWRTRSASRSRRVRSGPGSVSASSTASAVRSGRNSCSGGSSRRTVTGRPAMAAKIASKSDCCIGSSCASAASRCASCGREDHLAHHGQALGGHEHVLGAAQPDALGAELARPARVLGRVGVGAHAQAPALVGPGRDGGEVLAELGRHERQRAQHERARRAVDRDHVALAHDRRRRRSACARPRRSSRSRRRRRRACPCRARRRPRATSCRRAR